eukprot:c18005_g1_i5.p1 GENE.c18005_g1_i5~~c18005_g1_i5.p1  ORF type:complete len:562 (+),score=72.36 c18005_g1_i5:40-1725(+)
MKDKDWQSASSLLSLPNEILTQCILPRLSVYDMARLECVCKAFAAPDGLVAQTVRSQTLMRFNASLEGKPPGWSWARVKAQTEFHFEGKHIVRNYLHVHQVAFLLDGKLNKPTHPMPSDSITSPPCNSTQSFCTPSKSSNVLSSSPSEVAPAPEIKPAKSPADATLYSPPAANTRLRSIAPPSTPNPEPSTTVVDQTLSDPTHLRKRRRRTTRLRPVKRQKQAPVRQNHRDPILCRRLNLPHGLCFTNHGFLAIADCRNHFIRVCRVPMPNHSVASFTTAVAQPASSTSSHTSSSSATAALSSPEPPTTPTNEALELFGPLSWENQRVAWTIGRGYGKEDGYLNCPIGVAVTRSGRVFVSEYGNRRVQEFRLDTGEFVCTVPIRGLAQPMGISVNEAETLLAVADLDSCVIHLLCLTDDPPAPFTSHPQDRKTPFMHSVMFGVWYPRDVAFARDGSLVVSQDRDQVAVFSPSLNGTTSCKFGYNSATAGGFDLTSGVAVTAAGDILVGDKTRLQLFSFTGNHLAVLRSGVENFVGACGVAVDPVTGMVAYAEGNRGRVVVL